MNFGNHRKMQKIMKTEEELKKIHKGRTMYCSNVECKNSLKLTEDESRRVIMCSKCFKGVFTKKKPELKK